MPAAATAASRSRSRSRGCGMTSASPSSGRVSRNVCERTPMARPATNAPAMSDRRPLDPFSTARMSACAAAAAASPVMSLSGRSAVNQNSGDRTTMAVAHAARRVAPGEPFTVAPELPPSAAGRCSALNDANSRPMSSAPASVLNNARPRASGACGEASRATRIDTLPSAMNTG